MFSFKCISFGDYSTFENILTVCLTEIFEKKTHKQQQQQQKTV